MGIKVKERFLTSHPCYTSEKIITVKGVMLHSAGCAQPSAEKFIKSWSGANAGEACVHAFIDADTGVVYQTLPWNYRAWHCGGSGNSTHIGVEMCEPSGIRYDRGVLIGITDEKAAMMAVRRTYESAVRLFALLCRKYNLDPLEAGVIMSHKEGYGRGIASNHEDPEHLWNRLKTGYTMDTFRHAVKEALKKKYGGTRKMQKQPQEQDQKPEQKPEQKQDQKQEQPFQAMRISERGMALIRSYEGCCIKAYKCPAGVWTIGYGHTAGVKENDILSSEEEAEKLLEKDLEAYTGYVNKCVKENIISFQPTQNQFDALTSFAYNLGPENLKRLVRDRDPTVIAEKIQKYNKAGGKVLRGLVRRRREEWELFIK